MAIDAKADIEVTQHIERRQTAKHSFRRSAASLSLIRVLMIAVGFQFACVVSPAHSADEILGGYLLPFADAEFGRQLFVGKACVVCHSVNGVGGQVGPALDANASLPYVDPFDMAARMWRGASTMLLLQDMALGYQIDLTGHELANIARFLGDLDAQKRFSAGNIPQYINDLMVDRVYEELEGDETRR